MPEPRPGVDVKIVLTEESGQGSSTRRCRIIRRLRNTGLIVQEAVDDLRRRGAPWLVREKTEWYTGTVFELECQPLGTLPCLYAGRLNRRKRETILPGRDTEHAAAHVKQASLTVKNR